MAEVLAYFGLKNHGSNYKTVRDRAQHENINLNILYENGKSYRISKLSENKKVVSLEDIFSGKEYASSSTLRRKLLKANVIANECSICGHSGNWNNIPLSLQLDHIDGNPKNNSLSNLRLLCPNCHSQTSNFAGKNKRIPDKVHEPKYCEICGRETKGFTSWCHLCSVLKNRKILDRPSREDLIKLLKVNSYVSVGKMYNVSDNAIRKWLK